MTTSDTGGRDPRSSEDLREALADLAGDVLALMRRMAGNDHLAADLAQEALVRAMKHLDAAREAPNLRPWVFRIAINALRDHLRRRRPENWTAGELDRTEARTGLTPLGNALRRELDDELRHQILHLPERQREVLLLHGVQGLDHGEIAESLGISLDAVKTALYHGRESLRRRLQRYLDRNLGRRGRSGA